MSSRPQAEKPSVIFFGSGSFAIPVLEEVQKRAEVILVVTQPPKPAGRGLEESYCPLDLAAQDLCLNIWRPQSLKRAEAEAVFQDFPCDYLVVAAYGKILPQWLLDFPKYRPLNIHGSLLPKWRGAAPIQYALMSGDKETGVQLMQMTAGMDEGPIISEYRHLIKAEDSLESLTTLLGKQGGLLMKNFFLNPAVKAKPQIGEPSFAPKILKDHGRIRWESQSALEICRYLKALSPWPGLFSFDSDSKRIKILDCKLSAKEIALAPGQIIMDHQSMVIGTKDGSLELLSLQMEGKKSFLITEAMKDRQHWIWKTERFCSASTAEAQS